ncbi:unnamed protein product [Parnassius apollo]|uniref:(apollo) hypothetical protein n=1 Tax=Parnassius apollo TaxID=110799 RepID=A0A8S3YF66_PARAO|nr:unnamed protein product [Parnassius apollo]
MGVKEIYSDMMMDCFGLVLSHLDGKPTERLVCATCVIRLREAFAFRQQVLRCEEAFLQMRMCDAESEERRLATDGENLMKTEVKLEPSDESSQSPRSPLCDALADDNNYDPTREEDDSSNDDLPLLPRRTLKAADSVQHKEAMDVVSDPPVATILPKKEAESNEVKRPQSRLSEKNVNGSAVVPLVRQMLKQNLPMSKVQQLMRERDPSYMTETNILTIVEFSYVCPFKCRHNHLLCYYCGANFPDPHLLRQHTANSHHPKKFKVIEHKNMIKVDLTRIDCRLCSAKIDNLEDFKNHITSVHDKRYYFDHKDSVLPFRLTKDELKCAICHITFPYFHALNKHMNEHFSNYVCETCGLGFVDKGRFVMHQQRHEEGDFPCETCGKAFKAQYNRDLHVDRVHKKRARVYCPKCDIRLMTYQQKLKHLVEVHGEEPLSFPCNLCDRVCETRRSLTIHRRKDHLKDYRYECNCCGHKFFTRFALNNHMPTHTGERNFKCKVCEKSYPRLKTLKDHLRIHTNDRRYRCHVCGQAFIQNCSLKGHMKSQHPEYG